MNQETANVLADYQGEIYEEYSGRNMYGKCTTGVVFDSQNDFFKTVANIFQNCMEDEDATTADLIIRFLKNVQTDNMGTQVIYY